MASSSLTVKVITIEGSNRHLILLLRRADKKVILLDEETTTETTTPEFSDKPLWSLKNLR